MPVFKQLLIFGLVLKFSSNVFLPKSSALSYKDLYRWNTKKLKTLVNDTSEILIQYQLHYLKNYEILWNSFDRRWSIWLQSDSLCSLAAQRNVTGLALSSVCSAALFAPVYVYVGFGDHGEERPAVAPSRSVPTKLRQPQLVPLKQHVILNSPTLGSAVWKDTATRAIN